ncbi:MAG: glycosyltransferase [Verrucomicrobiota bacterium]|jgi:succinoglycan biosynthesis protein ExoA|nr:glycosyltransferase [Verrucomicrobiota bacterium]
MTGSTPTISIIIAVPPKMVWIDAVHTLDELGLNSNVAELIVTRGSMPSVQRNEAVKEAHGEWLYFLDNDSLVSPETWACLLNWISRGDADVVGGPNLCPQDAVFLQSVFSVLMGSFLAFGPSRSRYVSTGILRKSSEKELILCNLLVRRRTFDETGGFDESLYPNEENALMEAIARKGGGLWYDPGLRVHRYPREKLSGFLWMLFRYGRGRAQQFRLHPSLGSVQNMAPACFLGYLMVLLPTLLIGPISSFSGFWMGVIMLPAIAYLGALALQTLWNMRHYGLIRSLAAAPGLFFCHVSYGLGFLAGYLGSKPAPRAGDDKCQVTLEHREFNGQASTPTSP